MRKKRVSKRKREDVRERKRKRKKTPTQVETTHDGPVICWTPQRACRSTRTRGLHGIVHFLTLSRRVSYLQAVARATLWPMPIACDLAREPRRRGKGDNEDEEG